MAAFGNTAGDALLTIDVSLTSRGMVRLYGVWSVAFLATFMAGYGVASMTAINAIPTYQAYCEPRLVTG